MKSHQIPWWCRPALCSSNGERGRNGETGKRRCGGRPLTPTLSPSDGERESRRRATGRVGFSLVVALFCIAFTGRAAVPAPEKLLSEDTLVLVTAPDFGKVRELYKNAPQTQFWNDPEMKPFTDKFLAKWNEELVQPLERELDVKFDDYASLLQGQLTLALTQNGWQGESDQPFGLLLLLDTKDKSDQLKKHLADLQKKWATAGKTVKLEKIRNLEFSVLPLSSNDMPKTLRRFFPPAQEVQELGAESPKKSATPPRTELVVGQVDSLLIVGNSIKVIEPIVARLTGGALPALGESAAYQANHQALFREAPCYGWVNVKVFIDTLSRKAAEKKENPQAPNPFDIKPEKFISALGLAGLKTAAFTYQASNEGTLLQFFLGVPEANRQGLFKILAVETKESNPPPFVPADAVKFRRWRIDGKKSWATLEKTFNDISPQWLASINFIIDTANMAAKEKDPGFDVRKNLIGNLGDDLITYEKAPRGNSLAELQAPPALALVGSSNPEQMAAALKNILIFLGQQAGNPAEREFLGRKIFSVPLPALPLPMGSSARPGGERTLSYAASGGYLALSTDAAMLEEYLRTTETQPKALRETPGLAEAAQKVTGPGTGLFGYENQLETMRAAFEALRKDPKTANASSAASLLPASLNVSAADQAFKDWMDFSLLPGFEKVAKYFHFTVYGGSATTEGLTFKLFAPVPPGLKPSEPAK